MAKSKDETEKGQATGGYPYNSLGQSLKVGVAVKEHGGRDVPKHLVAESLGMTENSSGLYALITSAKSFGIVEGTRDLSLTDGARKYFYSTDDVTQRLAMLGFLVGPPKFRMLIEKYDGGGMPSASMLTSTLGKSGVPKSWASRAASLFVGMADEMGLLDDAGILRYRSTLHKLERSAAPAPEDMTQVPDIYEDEDETPAPTSRAFRTALAQPRHHVMNAETGYYSDAGPRAANVWTYGEGGGSVRLETSGTIPLSLWTKLKNYVDILKPSDSTKEEHNEEAR